MWGFEGIETENRELGTDPRYISCSVTVKEMRADATTVNTMEKDVHLSMVNTHKEKEGNNLLWTIQIFLAE